MQSRGRSRPLIDDSVAAFTSSVCNMVYSIYPARVRLGVQCKAKRAGTNLSEGWLARDNALVQNLRFGTTWSLRGNPIGVGLRIGTSIPS